jgi:hypothetical protein
MRNGYRWEAEGAVGCRQGFVQRFRENRVVNVRRTGGSVLGRVKKR